MNLTGPGVAYLSPDDVFKWKDKKALAENAVDGNSNIGESGGNGPHNINWKD